MLNFLYHGFRIREEQLGINPKVMYTYLSRMFTILANHYFEDYDQEEMEKKFQYHSFSNREHFDLPSESELTMIDYPRSSKVSGGQDQRYEFEKERDYIPIIYAGSLQDALGAVVVIPPGKSSSKKRRREAISSSSRSSPSQSSSSKVSKDSSSSSSRKVAKTIASISASDIISALNGLLADAEGVSELEKQNKKLLEERKSHKELLQENKTYKDLLWRYQMIHERLYSDYCSLYDAAAKSVFAKVKPKDQNERDQFVTKYLRHKTPLWHVSDEYLSVVPVQITMDSETCLASTSIPKMEKTLAALQNTDENYVNLSKATVLSQTRTPGQEEGTLSLMMGTNKYAEENKCEKLGIVPEPEAEINLSAKNLAKVLQNYSSIPLEKRFNLDQYIVDEEEEEEEDDEED